MPVPPLGNIPPEHKTKQAGKGVIWNHIQQPIDYTLFTYPAAAGYDLYVAGIKCRRAYCVETVGRLLIMTVATIRTINA